VLKIFSGTVVAQAISIILYPVITRLYGPEDFGIYGLFTTYLTILIPIAALSYPSAIVLPKFNQDVKYLSIVSFYLGFGVSIFIILGLVIFKYFGSLLEISSIFFLLPLAVFFGNLGRIFRELLIRKALFGQIALITVIYSLSLGLFKVLFGFISPNANTLILISTLGYGFVAIASAYYVFKKNTKLFLSIVCSKVKIEEYFSKIIKEYSDFAIFKTPYLALLYVSQGLPVIILTYFFSAIEAGFYTLCLLVLKKPSDLIGKSIDDVFYSKLAKTKNDNDNSFALIKKLTLILLLVGIVPYLTVYIFGTYLFEFVFGSNWSVAGEYASWLAIFMFFNLICRPANRAVSVFRIQKSLLIYQIILTTFSTIGLFIGFQAGSDILAVKYYSLLNSLITVIYIFIVFFQVKKLTK